jgi:probable phosphoglycerate mutase
MAVKEIYLIRHGQTDYNLRGVVQGRGVNSHLNETGRLQAKYFFEYYKEVPFDAVYTSTLIRTQQTVQHFLDSGHQHIIREELDEIDWGIFEGVEHNGDLQETYYKIMDLWSEGHVHVKIEGGESAHELQLRQQPFIDDLPFIEHERILVCSHGRAIRALLCGILGQPLSHMDKFKHNNTCLYKLSWSNGVYNMELENDLSHLAPLHAKL